MYGACYKDLNGPRAMKSTRVARWVAKYCNSMADVITMSLASIFIFDSEA